MRGPSRGLPILELCSLWQTARHAHWIPACAGKTRRTSLIVRSFRHHFVIRNSLFVIRYPKVSGCESRDATRPQKGPSPSLRRRPSPLRQRYDLLVPHKITAWRKEGRNDFKFQIVNFRYFQLPTANCQLDTRCFAVSVAYSVRSLKTAPRIMRSLVTLARKRPTLAVCRSTTTRNFAVSLGRKVAIGVNSTVRLSELVRAALIIGGLREVMKVVPVGDSTISTTSFSGLSVVLVT